MFSLDDLEKKLKKYASSLLSCIIILIILITSITLHNRMNSKMNLATIEAILTQLESTICYSKEAGQIFLLA